MYDLVKCLNFSYIKVEYSFWAEIRLRVGYLYGVVADPTPHRMFFVATQPCRNLALKLDTEIALLSVTDKRSHPAEQTLRDDPAPLGVSASQPRDTAAAFRDSKPRTLCPRD